jgi:hypothetical protein
MSTSIRMAARAAFVGMAAFLSANGNAQQTTEMVGPIAKLVADGYAFSGGTQLSPEQLRVITGPNKVNYEVKYRLGYAYFAKGSDFVVCEYELVAVNPIPDHFRLGKPDSKCFRIR